jgi:hypothetical protein
VVGQREVKKAVRGQVPDLACVAAVQTLNQIKPRLMDNQSQREARG